MKLIFLFLVFIFSFAVKSFCQNEVPIYQAQEEDVLHFKNGKILYGKIVEQDFGKTIKFKTKDDSIHIFSFFEITKTEKVGLTKPIAFAPLTTQQSTVNTSTLLNVENIQIEKPDLSPYGGQGSIGVSLLGSGLAGLSVRMFTEPTFALEFNLSYFPKLSLISFERAAILSYTLSANKFFNKYYKHKYNKPYKSKVVMKGVAPQIGYENIKITETFYSLFSFNDNFKYDIVHLWAGLSYIREAFLKSNPTNSFTFELGLHYNYYYERNNKQLNNLFSNLNTFYFFFKLQWNFYWGNNNFSKGAPARLRTKQK